MRQVLNMMLLTVAAMFLFSCSATSDKMYYTVSGSTVTVYNTPGGTMKGEMNFPTGASGGRQSLYVVDKNGNITNDTIDIEYDRTGVKSVTMKGVPIPRK